MPEDRRYSLICAYNPNGQKKTIVSKIMFDTSTNYPLTRIDSFILENKHKGMPFEGRLYVYDNKEKKVIPALPDKLDSLATDVIKAVINDKNNNTSVMNNPLWRGSFESILMGDLKSKGTFMHYLMEEKNADSKYTKQERPAFFYGEPSVQVILDFPYLPKEGYKFDNTHFSYNQAQNKYVVSGIGDIYSNKGEQEKRLNEYIDKLATWYSDYRNFRNYYLFRNKRFEKYDTYEDEQVRKDIAIVNKNFKDPNRVKAINVSQLNIFDTKVNDDVTKSDDFAVVTPDAKELGIDENGTSLTKEKAKEIVENESITEPDSDALDVIDEATQPKEHKILSDVEPDYVIPRTLTPDEQEEEDNKKGDLSVLTENADVDYNHLDAEMDDSRREREADKKDFAKDKTEEDYVDQSITEEHRNHPDFVKEPLKLKK